MKILGISGSPRPASTTDQLVQEVLAGAEGCDTEAVSLAGMQIGPCTACVGCADTNVCVIDDDLKSLREKIIGAHAYVIGGANYFGTLNALTHCFMERWYQFRHQGGKAVAGKIGAIAAVGGSDAEPVATSLRRFYQYHQIDCVGEVMARGPASCFTCGFGESCEVGAIHMTFGPGTEITDEITPSLSGQPEVLAAARDLGNTLSDRLHSYAAGT